MRERDRQREREGEREGVREKREGVREKRGRWNLRSFKEKDFDAAMA